ncbi:MAG: TetR/AcrR family transcriptional regulator [Acidobacteriota bacterium]|nr:TetR/AcrR family transcriptional regulator [Acidobacteriota bacterium]
MPSPQLSGPSSKAKARRGPRANPDATRNAILAAALHEFATEGPSGARTDHITRAAGVNKALLYYYYHDKETLYGAVLDEVFGKLAATIKAVLDRDLPPREKILAAAGAHFDFVAQSPLYPRLVQREMMRAGRSGSPHIRRLVANFLKPMQRRWIELLESGMRSGEFRKVDAHNFVLSIVALNVFYFSSAPVVAEITRADPLSPKMVAQRRRAVLDLLAAGLFREQRESDSAPHHKQARGNTR